MKKILSFVALLILTLHLTSCDDIDIKSPAGPAGMGAYDLWVQKVENGEIEWPAGTDEANFFKFLQGKQGEQGESGSSGANAYESWVEYIKAGNIEDPHNPGSNWDPNKNSIVDYYKFLTGAKGDDAPIPHVNPETGNWMIGNIQTDFPSKGDDGNAGTINGIITIGDNGNWHINGEDTGVKAQGAQGEAGIKDKVTIGDNGNWFINGEDTGELARGKDGEDGKDGDISSIIEIGDNGNWWINGKDTEKPAQGAQGPIGPQGPEGSAGALGKIEIKNGTWWVNGSDTGQKAQGDAGAPGGRDEITIDKDTGNWLINGEDSGHSSLGTPGKDGAQGPTGESGSQGEKGDSGKGAYELWVEQVEAGKIKDKDGIDWPIGNIKEGDFWNFLSGAPGAGAPTDVTKLEFVESYPDPNNIEDEIFIFESEEGATVTMSYGGEIKTGVLQPDGTYRIIAKKNVEKETPALASAIKKGKLESTNYLLNIPAQAAQMTFGNSALFNVQYVAGPPLSSDMSVNEGSVVHPGSGATIGQYYIKEGETPVLLGAVSTFEEITFTMDAVNVKDVIIINSINSNYQMRLDWNNDKTEATVTVIETKPAGQAPPEEGHIVTFQIVSKSNESSFIRMRCGFYANANAFPNLPLP